MKIAALETATNLGSVALLDAERTVEREVDLRGEGAVAGLGHLLSDEGVPSRRLDAVAASVGPGSFTGLRIGVSAAQGLCFAAGIPAIAIGTLEGLAWSAQESEWALPGTLCLASLDARRNEVYAALYRVAPAGSPPELLWGPEPVQPLVLAERFVSTLPGGAEVKAGVLCGDGAALLQPLFPEASGWLAPDQLRRPRAAAVASAGAWKFAQGDVVSPKDLEPIYLRKPDAQLHRERHSEASSGENDRS